MSNLLHSLSIQHSYLYQQQHNLIDDDSKTVKSEKLPSAIYIHVCSLYVLIYSTFALNKKNTVFTVIKQQFLR